MHRIFFAITLLVLPLVSTATGLGTISAEVQSLQRALNVAGYTVTNDGEETMYFGHATKDALTRYQIDHAAAILGGVGILNTLGTLDPLTKKHLMGGEVLGATIEYFTLNLMPKMKHPDVKRLQVYLNSRGFTVAQSGPGSAGKETTYYGTATTRAVKTYQEAYASAILTPNGLTSGTGLFLDATRNHVNAQLSSITQTTDTTDTTNPTRTITITLSGDGVVTTANGETCSLSPCVLTAPYGSSVTIQAIPNNSVSFTSWSGSCSGTTLTCTLTMAQDHSVTATFSTVTSSATLTQTTWVKVADENQTFTLSTSMLTRYGAQTSWVERTFVGTVTCSNGFYGRDPIPGVVKSCQVSNSGAVSPTTPTTYTLTTAVSGNGTIASSPAGITCGTDCTESFTSGTAVTLTATPSTGSTFAGWSGACTGTQTTCTVSMTSERTVTASFALTQITWVKVADENQTFTLSTSTLTRYGAQTSWVERTFVGTVTCSNGFYGRDPIPGVVKSCQTPSTSTITPTPINGQCGSSNGQSFTSVPTTNLCTIGTASSVTGSGPWYWSCAGSNGGTTAQCSAPMTTASTPTTYTLTVTPPTNGTITGTGITCGTDCSETYTSGTSVTLTATPASGYTFSGWSGACSGTGSCTVSMAVSRSVAASFVTTPTGGAISASIQATRLSGPAPLGVLFDASGTTGGGVTYPFHDLTYNFNFGDDRGLSWAMSGLPKNTQTGGPIAAHIFDLPGTYTIRVTAQNTLGQSSDATVTITVTDPNTHWSGTNTICVSTSANYTGCPSGAVTQTTLPTNYDGKRVLLRRGESFGTVTVTQFVDNAMIAPFGAGVKPRVERVTIGEVGQLTIQDFPDEITIMDLDVAGRITHMLSGSRILLYRNDLDDPVTTADNRIYIGGALGYYADNAGLPLSGYYNAREIFIVENRILGSMDNDATPHYNFYGGGSRFAMMGNEIGAAVEHTARFFGLERGFIAHNWLKGGYYSASGAAIRSNLKIHSSGLTPYADTLDVGKNYASSKTVIANNIFSSTQDNGSWSSAVAPQNDTSAEGIEDFIIENNRYNRGIYTNTELVGVGRRLNARGNVRTDGGVPEIHNLTRPNATLPAEWNGPYFGQFTPSY